MKVTITHLTKMAPGFVCVAGIEQGTRRHIRPMMNGRLRLSHVESHGGVFGLGAIVELGKVRSSASPPEIEDRTCLEHRLGRSGTVGREAFKMLLTSVCEVRLQRIFGRGLSRVGSSCCLPKATGDASLGVLRLPKVDDLFVEQRTAAHGQYETLRIALTVGQYQFRFPVTDLRFARLDDSGFSWEIDRGIVEDVREKLRHQDEVLLSVGLSRPFQRAAAEPPRHWVQVNNVHLAADPLWLGTLQA